MCSVTNGSSTPDGAGTFDAYCAVPGVGFRTWNAPLPGDLRHQRQHPRGVADRLAGEGYVAHGPDMFWRLERRFERKDESGLADAFTLVQQLDFDRAAVGDINAAHAHLLSMPECTGKVGAVGFCLGGSLAYAGRRHVGPRRRQGGSTPRSATTGQVSTTCSDKVESLDCPAMFHYGESDGLHPGGARRRR